MKLWLRILIPLVISFGASSAFAARNFMQCEGDAAPRSELDHFCPRIEGIHLEGCCPPLFKQPPLKCSYHVVVSRGQPFIGQSAYNACVDGKDVSIPCCSLQQRDCSRDKVVKDFFPRLLNRKNTCCFENCPSADYWRAPPAAKDISPQHEFGDGPATCTGTTLQECTVGATCQESTYCPPPEPAPTATPDPSQPTPAPTSPPPTPDPGPGTPVEDPGPSDPGPVVDPPSPPIIVNPDET